MSDTALFDIDEVTDPWTPIYKTTPGPLCRDCGRTAFSWEKGCGGARPGLGSFDLCDDCAALDGRGGRSDGHADASRWGISKTDAEAALLVAEQRKRRAAYVRRQERVA